MECANTIRIAKKAIVFIYKIIIPIAAFMTTVIFSATYSEMAPYGCYPNDYLNSDYIDLCPHWYKKEIGYTEYQDITAVSLKECSCKYGCIQSSTCDCDKLYCLLIGTYDVQNIGFGSGFGSGFDSGFGSGFGSGFDGVKVEYSQCNIAREYKLANSDASNSDDRGKTTYTTAWKYNDVVNYAFGDAAYYYINSRKFTGDCFAISNVEHVGDAIYFNLVGMIISIYVLVWYMIQGFLLWHHDYMSYDGYVLDRAGHVLLT